MLGTSRYPGGHGPLLRGAAFALVLAATLTAGVHNARAQTADEPALKTGDELETLIGPIALYPDDLVAIVLPAATYPLQIVQAARFLDAHNSDSNLAPSEEWDDAIVALLNYPEVVRMMNDDLDWTWSLGQAVLNQEADVIDAIQSFRDRAYAAGNLQSDSNQTVSRADGAIEIAPADPQVVRIPYYEPEAVVVQRPVHIYYYPTAYPLYYYPYPAGYWFGGTYFFGVTSAFTIGWYSHDVHVYYHTSVNHPYYASYRRAYYHPYYTRQAHHAHRADYVWAPNDARRGDRPRTYRGDAGAGRATPTVGASFRDGRRPTSGSGTVTRSRPSDATGTTRFAGSDRGVRAAPPRSDDRQSHPWAPATSPRAAPPPRASQPAPAARPEHSRARSAPTAQPAARPARPVPAARQAQPAARPSAQPVQPVQPAHPATRPAPPSSHPAAGEAPAAPHAHAARGRLR